jgi:hypothetical protein
MDHGNEHGEHLDDVIIADNEGISDALEISDDNDERSDEMVSLDDYEASGEGTSDDDELSDESVSVDGEGNTDDKIMSQIERNDPSMTSLSIGENDYYPFDEECANLGRAIGRNTHLKDVCVAAEWMENFNDLFRGLA